MCRGVIAIKCISIVLTVPKIKRDMATSVEFIGSFSKRNRHNRGFVNWHQLCYASGISSPGKKLRELETAQVKDIRAFLNSWEETEDLRNCFI